VIGDGVLVREFATVHQGTERPTIVGDGTYLMSRTHVSHDVEVAAGVTMAAGSSVAGHSDIGPGTTLGMGALVHQRRSVGAGAMVGMGCAVNRDVTPFTTVLGNPGRVAGVNAVALRRLGAGDDLVELWPSVVQGTAELPDSAPQEVHALWSAWREGRGVRS
jgi:UDP-N-acetylglucosamine acyltransferase